MNQQIPEVGGALPAPPADPLHILPYWSVLLLLIAALLFLLLLAGLVLQYLSRRRGSAPASPPPPVPRAPVPEPSISVATRIEVLERKFLESKAYREGCHALAGVAKTHLGKRTGKPIERMTSPEIAIMVKDERVGAFMTRLSRRRYGRDEPRRKHFVEACAKAREVLR